MPCGFGTGGTTVVVSSLAGLRVLHATKTPMQTNLTNEQVFDLQATFTTALGNPAPVTDITWANSDSAVIAITVDPTDPSKVLVSAVAPGTAVITVEAKTATGKIVDGAYNVVVELAEATLVVFIAGEPRLKQ